MSKAHPHVAKLLVKANKDTVRGVNLHTRADPQGVKWRYCLLTRKRLERVAACLVVFSKGNSVFTKAQG